MPCSGGTAYKEALTFCQPFKDRHWHWCRAKDPPSLLSNTPLHVLLSNFAEQMLVWLPSRSIQCTLKKRFDFRASRYDKCFNVWYRQVRLSAAEILCVVMYDRGGQRFVQVGLCCIFFWFSSVKGKIWALHLMNLGVLATPAEQSVRRSV